MWPARCVMLPLLSAACVTAARADDAAECRAILDRAVKAVGGWETLARRPAASWKGEGTLHLGGSRPYSGRWTVHLPDRCRIELEIGSDAAGADKQKLLFVVDGDRGWTASGGEVRAMSDSDLSFWREQLYFDWVVGLAPLRDPEFTLSRVDEKTVAGRAAVGVKVFRRDRPEVVLFFDKEDGRLVASELRVDGAVRVECGYAGYKDFDGVRHPAKVTVKREGRDFLEGEIADYARQAAADDKLFEKPKP